MKHMLMGCGLAISLASGLLSIRPPAVQWADAHSVESGFSICTYKGVMWPVTESVSRYIASAPSLSATQASATGDTLTERINRGSDLTGSRLTGAPARIDTALRNAVADVENAVDARDAGDSDSSAAFIRQAWTTINLAWGTLKGQCPLGHPAKVVTAWTSDGGEYLFPAPVESPYLSLRQEWMIQWSYDCGNTVAAFTIEVRSLDGHGHVSAGGTYIGQLITTAVHVVDQAGSGSTKVRGTRHPMYLLIRSRCSSSGRVIG